MVLQVLGALAAITLVFGFRNPKWNQLKTHTVTLTAGLGGFAFGRLAVISAHYNYLRSIENPAGFRKAMENIQSELGAPKVGLVIARAYQPSLDDNYTNQIPDDGNRQHFSLYSPLNLVVLYFRLTADTSILDCRFLAI